MVGSDNKSAGKQTQAKMIKYIEVRISDMQ